MTDVAKEMIQELIDREESGEKVSYDEKSRIGTTILKMRLYNLKEKIRRVFLRGS